MTGVQTCALPISANPRTDPDAKLITKVPSIEQVESAAEGAGSSLGTGGMITKINAAKIAVDSGIDMAIMNGNHPENLYRLFDGEEIGTHFIRKKE